MRKIAAKYISNVIESYYRQIDAVDSNLFLFGVVLYTLPYHIYFTNDYYMSVMPSSQCVTSSMAGAIV